ncbi:glutaminase [Microbacterium sp. T2.11-28]|uniref:glutaminase n=1 Tax=unclassified Microbacterium TaxID=2609290 RepID=UPI0024777D78|nr:glutaminase [Microbacterium sp. T2.11-28]CAI9390376.1 hypothetical protein MICABA_01437 [Microbacterium sp. T2.11-28]
MTDALGPTAAAVLDAARARLATAPREPLGEWASSRRLLGLGRSPRIVRVGEAWHLGVLLVAEDALYATGEILRAREDVVRGFTAQSQRERAERAAAAFRGGFAEGEALHLGWSPIDVDAVDAGGSSGPLSSAGGAPMIRWSASGAVRPLADYVADQLALTGR